MQLANIVPYRADENFTITFVNHKSYRNNYLMDLMRDDILGKGDYISQDQEFRMFLTRSTLYSIFNLIRTPEFDHVVLLAFELGIKTIPSGQSLTIDDFRLIVRQGDPNTVMPPGSPFKIYKANMENSASTETNLSEMRRNFTNYNGYAKLKADTNLFFQCSTNDLYYLLNPEDATPPIFNSKIEFKPIIMPYRVRDNSSGSTPRFTLSAERMYYQEFAAGPPCPPECYRP